jgi:hypothetical protein
MTENPENLDLELWLDQDTILRQNRLKALFWDIFTEIGNEIDSKSLLQIHPASRGIKLSKGNELAGYPYQVLDLIRDFNSTDGLNIRVLNWFGHGLFLFVLVGKNHPKVPIKPLNEQQWYFDQSLTPWEYSEILLKGASIKSPSKDILQKSSFWQWHKPIPISKELAGTKSVILNELKKLLFLFS